MKDIQGNQIPPQTVCNPTPRNIERQDFVDGRIFELINEILPQRKKIDWDIEVIATVREAIFFVVDGKVHGLNEHKFYP
ncbi:MAG: hypothetical protein COV91_06035 [Candidatus Taylorbacteria bacterium CG11_big_fil_rev_8_21_14_0_20_46_11]|uniref:Uncharacterized protein n=1 Tax=Candidatus Taylorbacteria bacterium CG11_big_fil_rev_8_21_14_0_20_46_11 TaxID=1975025 RepID=A0A2H0KA36_9BACT|nr:MAG: hypothetical protein COV91_06035 [Candidatus Taylorbacteria bacterium CG11_big_fil_rev_8_21_14_0_20_46_11]